MSTIVRNSRGQFVKGQPAHNKAVWIDKTCAYCGKPFSVKPSLDRVRHCSTSCGRLSHPSPVTGHKHSPETRAKLRAAHLGRTGPGHWNYRGYPGTERHTLMQRDEYKQWRKDVFERDGYSCRECGATKTYLNAHHIRGWAAFPDLRYELDNGLTLCQPCHLNVHRKAGESDKR